MVPFSANKTFVTNIFRLVSLYAQHSANKFEIFLIINEQDQVKIIYAMIIELRNSGNRRIIEIFNHYYCGLSKYYCSGTFFLFHKKKKDKKK